jgi:hypothetical protein
LDIATSLFSFLFNLDISPLSLLISALISFFVTGSDLTSGTYWITVLVPPLTVTTLSMICGAGVMVTVGVGVGAGV